MRPINLIPPDQRRGAHAPLRSGPLAYIVVGALVAVLAGVAALVLTGNAISEQESELAQVKAEDAQAAAKAKRLAAFTQFRSLSEQRVATVASLADSRFDWERVMRELSLVLPDDAWLVTLSATASPQVSMSGGEGGGEGEAGLRGSAPGPALEMSGCASSQEAVAGFVTSLKDIDGVTRVGVASSELADDTSGAGSTESEGGGGSEDCRTRSFIAKFSIVVAFDAAPVPAAASGEEALAAAAPPPEEAAPASTETPEGG